jgi:hypothetical protein
MTRFGRSVAGPGIVLWAALASGTGLNALSLDASSLVTIPAKYYAGDEVLLQAAIRPEAGEKLVALDAKLGAGLGAQSGEADPELRELRVAKTAGGWTLSLRFVPWSPGVGSIPEQRLKGLRIPAIHYAAAAILGPEDRDPAPPRPQLDPPGMLLYLYVFAALLLVLVLGGFCSAVYLVPAARSLLARRRAALAFKRLEKSLDYLLAGSASSDPASYCAALSRALRLYLAARALPEAFSLTSPEIAQLPEGAFPAPATRDRAAALFSRADRLRFGGEWPEGGDIRALLESAAEEARAIGAAIEEVLLARV